ncbi:Crossover junction endonuclease MUS81 [Cucumispora dikerogammari]|nr:Crossover junction endonuclease MUS81 [Cucumispora dikerogammari]
MQLLKSHILTVLNKMLLSRISSTHKVQLYKLKKEINKIDTPLQYTDIRQIKYMGPKTYKLILEGLRSFPNEVDLDNPIFFSNEMPKECLSTEQIHEDYTDLNKSNEPMNTDLSKNKDLSVKSTTTDILQNNIHTQIQIVYNNLVASSNVSMIDTFLRTEADSNYIQTVDESIENLKTLNDIITAYNNTHNAIYKQIFLSLHEQFPLLITAKLHRDLLKKFKSAYIPPYNSTHYNILKIFHTKKNISNMSVEMTKKQIQKKLTNNPPVSASLNALVKKKILFNNKETKKFSLTQKGTELCLSLYLEKAPISNTSFDISLIIDSREIKSKKAQTFFQSEFIKRDISIKTKSLSVGDFTWILTNNSEEYLVPYLIERKCLNDFLNSIYTKRLYEQLNRLKRYKNIFYIIEMKGFGNLSDEDKILFNKHFNGMKHLGITVLQSKNVEDTAEIISLVDSNVRRLYVNGAEDLIKYDVFEMESSKNLYLKGYDVFELVLRSIKGLTEDNIVLYLQRFKNLKDFCRTVCAINSGCQVFSEDMSHEEAKKLFKLLC